VAKFNITIAIVGVGQIGGSIALSLKGKVKKIIGISTKPAQCRKLVDHATSNIADIQNANVIILARTINGILKSFWAVKKYAKKGALVIDVGSTKQEIMKNSKGLNFIGGHPITGTEGSGPQSASKNLLAGRPFILVGRKNKLADRIVKAMGATPIWIKTAKDHDKSMAVTSHLPHIIAYSLCNLYANKKISKLYVGPSFLSAVRVAKSNPKMVYEIFGTNRTFLKHAVTGFISTMKGFLNNKDQVYIMQKARKLTKGMT